MRNVEVALLPPVSAGAALLTRRRRVSERAPLQALASRRRRVSGRAPRPTLRRRLGSELRRIPQVHSPAGLRAAGLQARRLRARSLRARSRRASDRPAPPRTSRRKPRQVSPTNHVLPTSDFRTGSRCALAFRELVDRTTRRDSASDQSAASLSDLNPCSDLLAHLRSDLVFRSDLVWILSGADQNDLKSFH